MIDTTGRIYSASDILTYASIRSQKIESDSNTCQILNPIRSVSLAADTLYTGSFPSTFVNPVWIDIAAAARIRLVRNKKIAMDITSLAK